MKKVIIVLIGIIVIALGIVGFFVWKDAQTESGEPIVSGEETSEKDLAELAMVIPVTIKEEARGVNRLVDVTYPSIQSFHNKNFQKYINDNITKVIFAYRDEINAIVDDETPASNLYTYKSSYEKYAHGDYLSLVISNDYQTGGIRSNKWKDIYNVDVRAERLLYLKDIFVANMDFEKEVLTEIKKQAEEKQYVLMNGEGLSSLTDSQKFYIKDGKLYIYFDPAEIAPASYGELQFEMPFVLEEGKFRLPTNREIAKQEREARKKQSGEKIETSSSGDSGENRKASGE